MKEIHVLNLGAGVQSTSLYLMSHYGHEISHVPRFDFAVFADTGDEPSNVYSHMGWLESLGGPPVLRGSAGNLGDHLIRAVNSTGQSWPATIPAFHAKMEGQKSGITRRQCTREYKTSVVDRVIRRSILGLRKYGRVPKDVRVFQYIGLSFDEPRRVISAKSIFASHSRFIPRFPLFDMEMTRSDCESYLSEVAPGRAIPRSACVFCPFRSDREWADLRDGDPAGWSRAVEIDRAIRNNDARCGVENPRLMYLHPSCVPLEEAPIDVKSGVESGPSSGFVNECEGMCGA